MIEEKLQKKTFSARWPQGRLKEAPLKAGA